MEVTKSVKQESRHFSDERFKRELNHSEYIKYANMSDEFKAIKPEIPLALDNGQFTNEEITYDKIANLLREYAVFKKDCIERL